MLHLQETANSSRVQGFLHQRLAALVLPRNPEALHSGCSVECAQRRFRFLGRRSICRPCCRFSLSTHCGGACMACRRFNARPQWPYVTGCPAACLVCPTKYPPFPHHPAFCSNEQLPLHLQERPPFISFLPAFLPACLPACLPALPARCLRHACLAGGQQMCPCTTRFVLLLVRLCTVSASHAHAFQGTFSKPGRPCALCTNRTKGVFLLPPLETQTVLHVLRAFITCPPPLSPYSAVVLLFALPVQGWRDGWDDWQEREEHRGKKGRAGTRCGLQGE
jgi:hypothetical protein